LFIKTCIEKQCTRPLKLNQERQIKNLSIKNNANIALEIDL